MYLGVYLASKGFQLTNNVLYLDASFLSVHYTAKSTFSTSWHTYRVMMSYSEKKMEKAIYVYGLYEPPWGLKVVQPQHNGNTAFCDLTERSWGSSSL